MKLSQLGEFGLIDLLSKKIGKLSKNVLLGIGDDTAVLQLPVTGSQLPVKYQLITTDTLIENIHFKLKTTSFLNLGYKALAINVSDIAAMGGVPTYALVTIGANKNLAVRRIEQLYQGIKKCAKQYDVDIIGGDTVQSPKELVVSITLLGEVEKQNLLTRAKAKVGDLILVTGTFGGPAAVKYEHRAQSTEPRTREARIIAKSRTAHSMIDSSDGLVRSVFEICKASKVGARIELDSVPAAKRASLNQALYGGEEYELVFTAPKAKAAELVKLVENRTGTKVSIVGKIVSRREKVKLVDAKGKVRLLKKKGYEHFK